LICEIVASRCDEASIAMFDLSVQKLKCFDLMSG
jgi:hypothetical protein